jgi:hypothetical protein
MEGGLRYEVASYLAIAVRLWLSRDGDSKGQGLYRPLLGISPLYDVCWL